LRQVCDAIGARADATWLAALANDGRDPMPVGAASKRPDYGGAVSAVSVGRWRTDLARDDLATVMRVCATRLRELGYEAA
jgi:hypothetical protein